MPGAGYRPRNDFSWEIVYRNIEKQDVDSLHSENTPLWRFDALFHQGLKFLSGILTKSTSVFHAFDLCSGCRRTDMRVNPAAGSSAHIFWYDEGGREMVAGDEPLPAHLDAIAERTLGRTEIRAAGWNRLIRNC